MKMKDIEIKKYFDFSEEVKKALKNKQPVVALESTLIFHGFPYPDNLIVYFMN